MRNTIVRLRIENVKYEASVVDTIKALSNAADKVDSLRAELAEAKAKIVGLEGRLDIMKMLREGVKHAHDCGCAVCTGCIT